MNLPNHVSEAVKRLNPALYSDMGAVLSSEREQAPQPALERQSSQQPQGERGMGISVTLVAVRKRLLDDDNNVGSLKSLRDHISRTIGIDDGDTRLKFSYGQVLAARQSGVIVKIERL